MQSEHFYYSDLPYNQRNIGEMYCIAQHLQAYVTFKLYQVECRFFFQLQLQNAAFSSVCFLMNLLGVVLG